MSGQRWLPAQSGTESLYYHHYYYFGTAFAHWRWRRRGGAEEERGGRKEIEIEEKGVQMEIADDDIRDVISKIGMGRCGLGYCRKFLGQSNIE